MQPGILLQLVTSNVAQRNYNTNIGFDNSLFFLLFFSSTFHTNANSNGFTSRFAYFPSPTQFVALFLGSKIWKFTFYIMACGVLVGNSRQVNVYRRNSYRKRKHRPQSNVTYAIQHTLWLCLVDVIGVVKSYQLATNRMLNSTFTYSNYTLLYILRIEY